MISYKTLMLKYLNNIRSATGEDYVRPSLAAVPIFSSQRFTQQELEELNKLFEEADRIYQGKPEPTKLA